MSQTLFFFNSTCEMAVANSQISYLPPAHLRLFENSLATMPCFFADENDAILTLKPVSNTYVEHLHKLGFKTPQFITSPDDLVPNSLPLTSLRPWGWSPAVHNVLKPFLPFCHNQWMKHPMHKWQPHHRLLLSRDTGYKLLVKTMELTDNSLNLIEISTLPLKLSTLLDVEKVIESIPPPALLKTPWSASGRGLFKIRDVHEHAETNVWVKSKLKQQGFMYAEPYLDKISDLSFHFQIEADGVQYLGYNFFETLPSGQFSGCYTHLPYDQLIDQALLMEAIEQGVYLINKALENLKINAKYQGPAGVDAILFRNKHNQIKLQPCIELNLRHSMGLLNIHLRKRIHPEKKGKWKISMLNAEEWRQMVQKYNKPDGSNLEDGYITKGIVALTPPPKEKGVMAWLLLEP